MTIANTFMSAIVKFLPDNNLRINIRRLDGIRRLDDKWQYGISQVAAFSRINQPIGEIKYCVYKNIRQTFLHQLIPLHKDT